MLGNINATINANAQSIVKENDVPVVICSFSGFVDANKQPSISKTIRDQRLYNENKAVARQDEDEFEEYLTSLIV